MSVTGGTPSGAITNPSEVRGGTLRFANSGDWDSLDPADTYFTDAWDFARLYGRSLVMFKPAPPGIAIFCPLACFCQPQEVLAGAAPRPGSPTGGAGLTEAAHHHTLIRDFSKGESGVYCVL